MMLSDNIRNNRKRLNLSQDELAEKLGVSRQSVSFWETGQTQPTIDNIIALSKVFNISSDMLLGNCESINNPQEQPSAERKPEPPKKSGGVALPIAIVVLVAALICLGVLAVYTIYNKPAESSAPADEATATLQSGASAADSGSSKPTGGGSSSVNSAAKFDLFEYCKSFAIEKGVLNGDYCIYQQPATKYGGYENEYFSISYWGDSDMVEFCLHCPLSETQSHNFYIRMRGGYNQTYEYASSKYYRDTGESFRSAYGYIDPAVFSNSYPISCDEYIGSTDGQNQFMEETRVGICDLIHCLKKFVKVEKMDCDFSDFDFENF